MHQSLASILRQTVKKTFPEVLEQEEETPDDSMLVSNTAEMGNVEQEVDELRDFLQTHAKSKVSFQRPKHLSDCTIPSHKPFP